MGCSLYILSVFEIEKYNGLVKHCICEILKRGGGGGGGGAVL